MKLPLTVLLILFTAFAYTQKKDNFIDDRGCLMVQGGGLKIDKYDWAAQGSISFGGMFRYASIGVGGAITKLSEYNKPIIPVFVELTILPRDARITPFLQVRGGTSALYKETISVGLVNHEMKGKFFYSASTGIAFKAVCSHGMIGIGYQAITIENRIKAFVTMEDEKKLEGATVFLSFRS